MLRLEAVCLPGSQGYLSWLRKNVFYSGAQPEVLLRRSMCKAPQKEAPPASTNRHCLHLLRKDFHCQPKGCQILQQCLPAKGLPGKCKVKSANLATFTLCNTKGIMLLRIVQVPNLGTYTKCNANYESIVLQIWQVDILSTTISVTQKELCCYGCGKVSTWHFTISVTYKLKLQEERK